MIQGTGSPSSNKAKAMPLKTSSDHKKKSGLLNRERTKVGTETLFGGTSENPLKKSMNSNKLSTLIPSSSNVPQSNRKGNLSQNNSTRMTSNFGQRNKTENSAQPILDSLKVLKKQTPMSNIGKKWASPKLASSSAVMLYSSDKQKAGPKNSTTRINPKTKKDSLSVNDSKLFKIEYLKDEKLSKLSESHVQDKEDQRRLANPVGRRQENNSRTKSPKVEFAHLDATNKLKQARISHNLMHNVRCINQKISQISDASHSEMEEDGISILENMKVTASGQKGADKNKKGWKASQLKPAPPASHIFVLGGVGDATKVSHVLRYDMTANKWEELSVPIVANKGGAYYNREDQSIVVFGGRKVTKWTQSGYYTYIQSHDP
jgi:hypothetical protein